MSSIMRALLLCALTVGCAVPFARADTLNLGAAADNTLYEDFFGGVSNGAGEYFFAGTTNSDKRRGLIRFDVSAIPAGSTINGVTMKLHMSRTTASAQNVSIHRVLASWGEGASNAEAQEGAGAPAEPGDATWTHRYFGNAGSEWTNDGGDYAVAASATRSVGGVAFYTWGSTPAMVADVAGWVNGTVANNGWLLFGNESTIHTAKRFDTRENMLDTAFRPVLTVNYTPIPEPTVLLPLLFIGLGIARRR